MRPVRSLALDLTELYFVIRGSLAFAFSLWLALVALVFILLGFGLSFTQLSIE